MSNSEHKRLENFLKTRIRDLVKLSTIRLSDNRYVIDYIAIQLPKTGGARFKYNTEYISLSEMRDFKLDTILNQNTKPANDLLFDTSNCTDEEIKLIHKLREPIDNYEYGWRVLEKVKNEYSRNFEVGQRVYYKGLHGIITFKHSEKEDNTIQRWTVTCKDVENRYVYGTSLTNRKIEDLSHIEIDKKLDKLPTEKLLKMYRKGMKLNYGRGNKSIKRILMDRENVN